MRKDYVTTVQPRGRMFNFCTNPEFSLSDCSTLEGAVGRSRRSDSERLLIWARRVCISNNNFGYKLLHSSGWINFSIDTKVNGQMQVNQSGDLPIVTSLLNVKQII